MYHIMCRNAKVVQPYYSMCYFIYSFIYLDTHMFSIVECMYRADRRPYEAITGKPDTSLLTYTTVDV